MRLTSFVAGTTSAQEAGTTWLIDVHFPQMSISSSLSCSNCRTAALKLRSYGTLSDMQMPRWDGKQPAAETVPRTEKLQPLSDVWIKVELFPSCLHNNTRYRSSAAVSACGWHYLSGRHSLSDLQMDLALLQSQSLWTKDELKLGHIPGETLIKVPRCLPLTFCYSCVCASFPPGAQSPESQLEPVNWTNVNCHCMFVAGCLQGTASLSGNLGQGKPTQRCRLGKKRMTGATTWWHHGLTNPFCHLIFEVGITNCD